MSIVVQKYGGSSVSSPDKIREVANHIVKTKSMGDDVVVVVSAMGDTTDDLLSLAKKVSSNPPKREMDMLLSSGERISMALLSMAVNELGYKAISLTGSQSGIITDSQHMNAKILEIQGLRIRENLSKGKIVIVAGFQGVSTQKEITTLGRGGSDTTAVALAVALNAKECQIFTDVDGVFTANPNVVRGAKKIEQIGYEEMCELANLGASVLHTRSVEIAAHYGMPLRVTSSSSHKKTNSAGTLVTHKGSLEYIGVRGITYDERVFLFCLRSVPRKNKESHFGQVVSDLSERGISIRLFFHSAGNDKVVDLVFLISEEFGDEAWEILKKRAEALGAMDLIVNREVGIISCVGYGIGRDSSVLFKMLKCLKDIGIHIEALSSSEMNITSVISRKMIKKALRTLHRVFIS